MEKINGWLDTNAFPFSNFEESVVMMFNLPLPGGTTGDAVGMGITTIVLGPWASILAISVALLIQAIFFGDGGITAFGANCLNMAVIGSLVVSVLYRAISGRASIDSPRRIAAVESCTHILTCTTDTITATKHKRARHTSCRCDPA